MTRINVIPPQELYDQHLIAEYREMRLLSANLLRSLKSKKGIVVEKLPKVFTLNKGHCSFFYDKGKYLHNRYDSISKEMIDRGFEPHYGFPIENWPYHLYNDWTPTEEAMAIVRKRIAERVAQRPNWYRYRGEIIKPRIVYGISDWPEELNEEFKIVEVRNGETDQEAVHRARSHYSPNLKVIIR